jgi:hypothetical protein
MCLMTSICSVLNCIPTSFPWPFVEYYPWCITRRVVLPHGATVHDAFPPFPPNQKKRVVLSPSITTCGLPGEHSSDRCEEC